MNITGKLIDRVTGPFSPVLIWLIWTVGSFLGIFIALSIAVWSVRFFSLNEDHWIGPIFLASVGILLGGMQVAILSRRVPPALWILSAVTGFVIALLIVWAISKVLPADILNDIGSMLVIVTVSGTTGFARWLFLRKHWDHAVWWIPAGLLGGFTLAAILGPVMTDLYELLWIGVFPASITGLVVARLFHEFSTRKGLS